MDFKFKQYHRESVYLVDDIIVKADSLQDAKDKLMSYINKQEEPFKEDITFNYNVNFTYFVGNNNFAYTIKCCEDNSETENGEFVKPKKNKVHKYGKLTCP